MRILITYASAGVGHRKAAEAIYKAFKSKFASNEVYIIDALDYSNIIFRWSYPRIYLGLINHFSLVWGSLYYLTDNLYFDFLFARVRKLVHRINGVGFEKFLLKLKPGTVISTHFFPSEIVADLKKRKKFNGRLITVITDILSHSFWILKGSDDFVVAQEETKKDLLKRGIRGEKIHILGIPIDPIFSETKTNQEILRRLEIAGNCFNVLIVSGGFGVGPIKGLVLNFERLKESFGLDIQLLVICGRNPNLLEELKLLHNRLKIKNRIYGFVENMDEFMLVSDVMITKSGGITISEALSKNLPMIIIRPIPGQETRNCALLLKYGVAIKVNSVIEACRQVKGLIDAPERLFGMKVRSKVLAHPDAALEIADLVVKR